MIKKLLSIRETPIFLVFLLFFLVAGIGNHQIFSKSGVHDILFGSSIVALLAIGETTIIAMKHIDLSVGSTIGFSSYLIGKNASQGHGLIWCLIIGIGLGLIVGAINGVLVAFFRLPSLVVTLGTLYLVRGFFNQIAGGDFINSGQVPKLLTNIAVHSFLDVPELFWVVIVVAVIVGFTMRYIKSGRDLYAIGSNSHAASLAGINVAKRTFFAFLCNGAIAGFAGAVLIARYGQAQANSGLGIELSVVAACVVGGVAIAGGVGSVYGAIIGAVLLQTIVLALGALGVSQFWQGVVNGALLIAAISLDKVLSSRQEKTQIMRRAEA
jgi:rhamnose transport system permease protein